MYIRDHNCGLRSDECDPTQQFKNQISALFNDMAAQPAPYKGEFELEVEMDNGAPVTTKSQTGLTANQIALFDGLQPIAEQIVQAGGSDDSKIKVEGEVETEDE